MQKPPRRNKRSTSLQPEGRPKSEFLARTDDFTSQELLQQGTHSASTTPLTSPSHHSTGPTKQDQFLFTELSTIKGSCEIAAKDGKSDGEQDDDLVRESRQRRDPELSVTAHGHSNEQPLQPNETPSGDVRKLQSQSNEGTTQPQISQPTGNHRQGSSGNMMNVSNPPISTTSECGSNATKFAGQSESSKTNGSISVTITVSGETDSSKVPEQGLKLKTNHLTENEIDIQTGVAKVDTVDGLIGTSVPSSDRDSDREDGHHHLEQLSIEDDIEVVVPTDEGKNTVMPMNIEWVGNMN